MTEIPRRIADSLDVEWLIEETAALRAYEQLASPKPTPRVLEEIIMDLKLCDDVNLSWRRVFEIARKVWLRSR